MKKTKISILPYAHFLVVLLERIQDFWLQYFTYSYGNMQYILENWDCALFAMELVLKGLTKYV